MSATNPSPLDQLERRAQALARPGGAEGDSWEALLKELEALQEEPPELEPDKARSSSAELRFLVAALRGQVTAEPLHLTNEPTRAGYLIEGTPTGGARVRPAFAQALAAATPAAKLLEQFSDLPSIDARLFMLLTRGATTRELALAWLESPGRRLVQDLSVLDQEIPWEALEAAMGQWSEHLGAIPGFPMRQWKPAEDRVGAALQSLQGRPGEPVMLRGAALRWLLARTAQAPAYELGGTRRNLQDDLPPALIAGFAPPDAPGGWEILAVMGLQRACLLHGALLAARTRPDPVQRIQRAWGLARWIQSCTFRSPFFGMDEEALEARLLAELPEKLPDLPADDVLSPLHFSTAGEGIPLDELALVAGAAEHYLVIEGPRLLPTPLPLVQALRHVSGRWVRRGELRAEEALRTAKPHVEPRPGNALGWAARHVAPPLVARWVMTMQRIAWMGHVEPDIVEESLQLFDKDPATHHWMVLAVYSEGSQMEPRLRQTAADVWRRVARMLDAQQLGDAQALIDIAGPTHMAAGVLDKLEDDEVRLAVAFARRAKVDWRYRGLEGMAEAAERLQHHLAWRCAMDELLVLMEDAAIDPTERVKASLLALRRLLARPLGHPDRVEYLKRISALAASSPFSENITLRNQLRKQSLLASA